MTPEVDHTGRNVVYSKVLEVCPDIPAACSDYNSLLCSHINGMPKPESVKSHGKFTPIGMLTLWSGSVLSLHVPPGGEFLSDAPF